MFVLARRRRKAGGSDRVAAELRLPIPPLRDYPMRPRRPRG
jgi:hypothetical protein